MRPPSLALFDVNPRAKLDEFAEASQRGTSVKHREKYLQHGRQEAALKLASSAFEEKTFP